MRKSELATGCLCALGLVLTGCDPQFAQLWAGGPEALDEYLDFEAVIGGSNEAVVFHKADFPSREIWNAFSLLWLVSGGDPFERFTPTLTTAVVDTATGLATLVNLDMSWEENPVSDGRRIVWGDADEDVVRVYDVSTGQTASVLAGAGALPQVVAGDYLIAVTGWDAGAAIIALNLVTGEPFTLETGDAVFTTACDGTTLAVQFSSWPEIGDDAEADVPPALGSSSIDVIDLRTRFRRTIYTTEQAGVSSLVVTRGRVIWLESIVDGDAFENARFVVRSHTVASGADEVLMEIDADFSGFSGVVPAYLGPSGVVMMTLTGDEFTSHVAYELRTYDGDVHPLFEGGFGLGSLPFPSFPWPAGELVVYRDPATGSWVIYDPATRSRRSVTPFAAATP